MRSLALAAVLAMTAVPLAWADELPPVEKDLVMCIMRTARLHAAHDEPRSTLPSAVDFVCKVQQTAVIAAEGDASNLLVVLATIDTAAQYYGLR